MATTTKKAIVLATSLASLTAIGTVHAEDQGLTKSIMAKAERIKRTETHARKAEEINKRSEDETNQKRATDNERKQKEEQARLEQEKTIKETPKEEAPKTQETPQATPAQNTAPVTHEDPRFGSDGLLIMDGSGNANQVYSLLNSIPGKMNGGDYHKQTGVDNLIDTLTTSQAFWVLYKLEGPGFGQLADGYAGFDTHESHQALITNQLNNRFNGSIHQLLKVWGTLGYSGY